MKHHSLRHRLLAGVFCCLLTVTSWSAERVGMVFAGSSTNAQAVRDIEKHVANPAGIDFDVRHTAGSPDTLLQLREDSGQQFAILQADVAEAYLAAATRGSVDAAQLFTPLRVIAPLNDEQVFFIVRSDSPLNFVHEIEHARINLGPMLGGTSLTAATLYRLMFAKAIPDAQTSFYSHQNALIKLTEGAIDVVALVAPNPVRLLSEMKMEARHYIKLLKLDPNHSAMGEALKTYSVAAVPAADYPNLLDADLPALAVQTYLVSYGGNDTLQARFATAWCKNLPQLRAEGNPALGRLAPEPPPLVPGWRYSQPFERELRACNEGQQAPPEPCTQEERSLGLCK